MDSTTGRSSDRGDGGNRSERVSTAVIAEVAAVTDTDPLDLEPLYSVIDPDALDALFRGADDSSTPSMTVHFTMEGCDVLVHGAGEVSVMPPMELDDNPTPVALTDD